MSAFLRFLGEFALLVAAGALLALVLIVGGK